MSRFPILIAEDDADDRFLLQKAFEENGIDHELIFVENGVQATDYLKGAYNATHQYLPKLILLDLNMPKKDGRQVLKEIKEHPDYKKIPVVVFTTSRNEMVIDKCYELGANTYIVKPISFEGLLKIVERIKTYWMQTAVYLR